MGNNRHLGQKYAGTIAKLSFFAEAKCEYMNLVLRRGADEALVERGLKRSNVGDGAGAVLRARQSASTGSGGRGGGESGGGGPRELADNLGASIIIFESNTGGNSSSKFSDGGASISELDPSEEERLDWLSSTAS